MMRIAIAAGSLVLVALAVASCTSSETSSEETTTEKTCTCSVSVNGEEAEMKCGEDACVGGSKWICSESRSLSKGDAC